MFAMSDDFSITCLIYLHNAVDRFFRGVVLGGMLRG